MEPMKIEDWIETMSAHFPIVVADESWQLDFVAQEPSEYEPGALQAVLRSITWDEFDGQRMVRDIKEQSVAFGRLEHFELRDRYVAYLRALKRVLAGCDPDELTMSMPSDCVHAEVLDLVSVRDEDGFVAALSTPGRLGALRG